jgi:SAM-dependent methyltransferase
VNAALLELLACPQDGSGLELAADELTCAHGHRFEVREGIPRMAPDYDEGAEQSRTFESFSSKWSRISSEEVEQRYVQQYAWYLDRYGFADEEALAGFLQPRGAILDAGTGTGGDAARFARLTDAQVVGLDLSVGIDVAQKEFGGPGNLHYIQGDILRPPFKQGAFGFVSSDQVIHHTPDAPRAFRTLASLLSGEGAIAVYVYKQKGLMRELADNHIREVTTKMTDEECMEFSHAMSELGRELAALDANVTVPNDIPLLGIEAGEHDVQRLLYWHFLKCFWNDDFSENLNDLVNFDWYSPPFASRHTPDEVESWCEEAGLGVDRLDVVESGISVLASRS